MNHTKRGFTVIELLFIVVLVGAASILFFVQRANLASAHRDDARKTSINAMYYGLEEVYYPANGSYPRVISADVLPSVDPLLFKDPNGVKLGENNSEYRYEPSKCDGDACRAYTIRTILENEADYIKNNRR